MKIISTNIATPKIINWRGKEVKTGIYKIPQEESVFLGNEDVDNDYVIDRRYHGGFDKACYIFSEKHYTYWKEKYPKLEWDWGMFGENLTVSELDESEIFVGDVFEIGEAIVQATQPRQPCFKLGVRFGTQKMIKQFIESGHSGVYVRVLRNGMVKTGDSFKRIEQTKNLSIREIFELIYADISHIEKAKKAIEIKELADSCRKDLMKHYKLQ